MSCWPRLRLLAALAAALALAACGAGEASRPRADSGTAVSRPPRPAPAPTEALTAQRRERQRQRLARPTRIEIPAIGVAAPVIELGLNRDRTLEVPRDFGDAGWWKGGPRPGEDGPAVIAGHVDSRSGPGVFYRLDELERGSEIRVVGRDGSSVRFEVERLERHPKDRFPTEEVYLGEDGPALRLITCSGAFDRASGHYEDNTIVFAQRA